ncbi:aryl-alcohol dehydrogenase-like predicted oxidoreductase [Arthrobacter sp. UYCu723]
MPDGVTTAQAALAWVIAQDGVTTAIPGAHSAAQARANAAAGAMYDVGTELATGALDIYDRYFREAIHPRW